MMIEIIKPSPSDLICDPACGTAGFLVAAAEYIRKNFIASGEITNNQLENFRSKTFTGFDTDTTMLRISAMNLMLHLITKPEIIYLDSVSKNNTTSEKFTVCLANPPFKGTIDAEIINKDLTVLTDTKKTELLFLSLFLRMLKNGGRCACIVPDGVLFGTSTAHISIRRELVEHHQLTAVISMPSGIFKPYAGVSTAVLIFTKTGSGGTKNVWFYDMQADGFTLDDKRSPIPENDIPDIITRFNNLESESSRTRKDKSFLVPREEIAANNYDLSINKYRENEYIPVEYPDAVKIIDEIDGLEKKIIDSLAELRAVL